jgi:DnaJ-class molecular chaperone
MNDRDRLMSNCCGRALPADANFCPRCGRHVREYHLTCSSESSSSNFSRKKTCPKCRGTGRDPYANSFAILTLGASLLDPRCAKCDGKGEVDLD